MKKPYLDESRAIDYPAEKKSANCTDARVWKEERRLEKCVDASGGGARRW